MFKDITFEDLKEMMKEDKTYQFIDVRTKTEYDRKNVDCFVNIDYYKFLKDEAKIHELNKEIPSIIICETGVRSVGACKILHKLGHKELYNVKRGMLDCDI